jgi:hypothetical protein
LETSPVQIEFRFDWSREQNPADYVVKGDHRRQRKFADIIDDTSARIVARNVSLQTYRPLEKFPKLYEVFAAIRSADDAIKFVRTYGPLTEDGLWGKGDAIHMIVAWARNMDAGHLHVGFAFALLKAWLLVGKDGPYLTAQPSNLHDALWLQYAEARAAGLANRCKQCKRLFAAGPDAGRRKGAEFCSIECKTKYHSLKRSR